MGKIEFVEGWRTSDGQMFECRGAAEVHQAQLDFISWCEENICRGGVWTAKMVAGTILERWDVQTKPTGASDA